MNYLGGFRAIFGIVVALGLVLTAPPCAALTDAPDEVREMQGLELYGIVIEEPGDRYAFVHDGNPGNRIQKIKVGQTIAGALVKAILPDQVTFVMSGSDYALYLRAYKAGVPATGLLNEGIASRGLNDEQRAWGQDGGAAAMAEVSPRPPQLTQPDAPLIRRQQMFPERPPSQDPPWQPPVKQNPPRSREGR